MANEEHLRILREGVNRWNQWRVKNPEIIPDLSRTNLKSTDLSQVNFAGVDLRNSTLRNANLNEAFLYGANLRGTNLSGANLSKANLGQTYLSETNFNGANLTLSNLCEADLSGTDLSEANLEWANLHKANLSEANLDDAILEFADLSEANLNKASFRNANLCDVSFRSTQALGTIFDKAELTGACIEDWNLNSQTDLDNVACDYVYLKYDERYFEPCERQPHSRNFAEGEFTKRHRKILEALELFFSDGVDWRAFFLSFQDLRVQYEEQDLSIQAIENKNGAFVIRLNVSPDADKGAIERQAMELYETRLAVLEAQYQGKLKAKSKELNSFRRELQEERRRNTWMEGIIQTMSEKEDSKYDLRYSKFGGGFAGNGGMQIGGTFIDASSNQTLVEVAQEIQQIYDQLLQTQPSETLDELELAKQVKAELEKRPTLKERFVGLLKNGGAEALKELVNRSGFNILLEAARGWMNPE